ncbi:hypothetical protein HID58_057653 [Brassica napus]|uniref:Uncharacterized protein n=1 Tax=Brassica napus TaxID=3708 RepID=A0ABQ8ARP8_BRANA|nr:hypothetical protein HID58_057653 [Brassica napus]
MELPVGHVVAGVFFLLICLWHSFNNIKLFRLNPNTFSSSHGSLSPSSARPRAAATAKGLTFLALAAAFAQQLFLLHLHSGDNMNLEGQYHLLFQFVIFASLITTLMGIAMPPKNKLMLFTVRKSTTHLQYNHQRTN